MAALVLTSACGGSDDEDRAETSGGEEPIPREECLGRGEGFEEAGTDANGNGTLDVVHVTHEGVRVCSAFDRDLDGDHDLLRFYEEDGRTPRLEQQDYDFDGRIDEVVLFVGGVPVRRDADTDFDDRIDLFVFCDGSDVARVERIRMGAHARVDSWEDYEGGYIRFGRYDEDGDGEADRFEYYRDGLLIAEAIDRNGDGEASAEERSDVEDEFAGRPMRLTCGTARAAIPARRPATPAAVEPAASAPASDAADGEDGP